MTDRSNRKSSYSHPLIELTRSRILSFVREPGSLFWVFVFPVLLAVALGTAFRNRPPESYRVGVARDGSAAPWAHEALSAAPDIDAELYSPELADEALRIGKVDVMVVATKGDESRTAPEILFHFDPTRPQSRSAKLAADDALQRALGRRDLASTSSREITESGSRYIDFLLPGLIGLNLMGSSMWGLGFVLVMSRVRKLLKRLAATPMRRAHYLLSMMLSRLVYLGLELAALLAFGWLVFGVEIHGSILAVATIAFIGAASFTGLALLVGARPTSIETASGLMNFVMLPMWVLSGSFFSYARFPEGVQPFIRLLPLTALNDALRAVMNQGASFFSTWPQLAVLVAWGLVSFLMALKIFRWQ